MFMQWLIFHRYFGNLFIQDFSKTRGLCLAVWAVLVYKIYLSSLQNTYYQNTNYTDEIAAFLILIM